MVHDPRVTQQLSRLGGLYRDVSRVDRDASTLLKSSMGEHLRPIAAEMVENDGTVSLCLVLQGTIPIHFKGQTFQQLIDLYLPAGYPGRPPICYVRLANDNMYLKENHAHVGNDGQVYLPYLHEWNKNSSESLELIITMSSVFSADPPVFAKSAAAQTTTVQPPKPATSLPPPSITHVNPNVSPVPMGSTGLKSPPVSGGMSAREPSWQRDAEAILAAEAAEANAAVDVARKAEVERIRMERDIEKARREEEQKKRDEEQLAQVQQESMKEQVAYQMRQYLQSVLTETREQVVSDQRDAQRLESSEKTVLIQEKMRYQQLKADLTSKLDQTNKSIERIKSWLDDHHKSQQKDQIASTMAVNKENDDEFASIDKQVTPASKIHGQMLSLSAENAAIADALYFLDRGLDLGHVSCDVHQKMTRKLAKKQFLVRAHLVKLQQMGLS
jgi:ESCRT-I complex subunit TSG101